MLDSYFVENAEDTRYVTALARGLRILACFNENIPQLTHQQICDKTGLPKATVSRLLYTLVSTGYLSQDNGTNYQVGLNALKLGHAATTLYNVSNLTSDVLEDFAVAHQVSVSIATHYQGVMRYVACYRSPAKISVNLEVGSEVPLEKTAIGRAFYATCSPDDKNLVLAQLQKLLSKLEYQQALSYLEQANQFYTKHHYAISDGEFMSEILAIAVGIPSTVSKKSGILPTYSINVSVPSSQWQAKELIDTLLVELQNLASILGQRLAVL